MFREDIIFGPISSRRLGRSLGINLLPDNGKVCNFDCIYCECGWNQDGRCKGGMHTAAEVRSALEDKLADMMLKGERLDSITFSGDGEPTLNKDFPIIIDDTLKLRDVFFPNAKVSVLSNATRAHVPEVFDALTKVDNPILKIDAPTDELAAIINRPVPGYSVARVVEALKRFEGNFCLQTMFLRNGSGFDSTSAEVLDGWMNIVRTLKPRLIMAYTIDRPTPEKDLSKVSEEEMRAALKPLFDEGFDIQICG